MWERDKTHPNADNLRRISEITGQAVDALLRTSDVAEAEMDGGRRFPELLARFLESQAGRRALESERRTLESVLYHGMMPTEAALEKLLEALRLCEKSR